MHAYAVEVYLHALDHMPKKIHVNVVVVKQPVAAEARLYPAKGSG